MQNATLLSCPATLQLLPNLDALPKPAVVLSKGPVPSLTVSFSIDWTDLQPNLDFYVIDFTPEAELGSVPFPVDQVNEQRFQRFPLPSSRAQGAYSFRVLLYPQLIGLVNSSRKGDLKGRFTIKFRYLEKWGGSPPREDVSWNSRDADWSYSRDEWNAFLASVGYEPALIVEIPLPPHPAWETVRKHLLQARAAYIAQDALALATACRAAWLAAKPELSGHWQTAKELIDRGTKPDENHLPKSSRVGLVIRDLENLLGSARYLADTAGHAEAHDRPSWEESVLIYQLTLPLIGFAAKLLRSEGPTVE